MNKKVKLILSKAIAFVYIFILNLFHTRKKVNSGKVLIIAAGHMGNAILDIDAIMALKNFFRKKNKKVYLLCSLTVWETFDLIADMSDFYYIENAYPYGENGTDFRNVYRAVSKIRQLEFEKIIVTLSNAPLAHYIVAASVHNESWGVFDNVKHTHGSIRYYFERKYTNKVFAPIDLHETQRLKMLIKRIGVENYEVQIHYIERKGAFETIQQPYITIAMDSMCMERRWPRESFKELMKLLLDKYPYDICCTGGIKANDIYKYCSIDMEHAHRIHNYAGKTNINEWIELIRGAVLHIGVDSGSIHVAASVGTQAISLSGVWDGKRSLPYHVDIENENTCLPVCVYRDDVDVKKMPCYACKAYGGRYGRGNTECYKKCQAGNPCLCLQSITPKTVMRAVTDYFGY